MPQASDRRAALRTLGAFAILPVGAAAFGSWTAAVARTISVPSGMAFRLTRTLERELSGGAAIVVERVWECRFESMGRGLGVTGEQVSARVDAPPALAGLSRIEEMRVETGFLPAALDDSGAILARETPQGDDAAVRSASDLALALFEDLPAGDPRIPLARDFLTDLSNRAALLLSRVPRDLFFPEPGERHEERHLAAEGLPARIAIATHAEADSATGLLIRSERTILTEIGDSTRRSRDTWVLHR